MNKAVKRIAALGLAYGVAAGIYSTVASSVGTRREDGVVTKVTSISPLTPWKTTEFQRWTDVRAREDFHLDNVTILYGPRGLFGVSSFTDGGWNFNLDSAYDGKIDRVTKLPPFFALGNTYVKSANCTSEYRKKNVRICDDADRIFTKVKNELERRLPK